jgi:phospho-N-acetylmuramoyl-pentapeptide-transferase
VIYHVLYPLHDHLSVLRVVGYLTFRTAAASLTALALSLLLGPWLIKRLRAFQVGQTGPRRTSRKRARRRWAAS